jgi:hypothetical protein
MATDPTEFGKVAPALHSKGWRPIPLDPATKKPAEGGWPRFNTEPWPEHELRLACIHHHHDACGLALPSDLLAVDCDVLEPGTAAQIAAAAQQHLGATPLVRVGRSPKWLRLYRAGGSVASRKTHPLELFCGSGQVAAFGWHQGAGRPYHWPEASPLDLSADDAVIPRVTHREVDAFLAAAGVELKGFRKQRGRGSANAGKDAGAELGRMLRSGVPYHVAARLLLGGAEEGGRHDAVRAVVSAGFNRGFDADRVERVVVRHAPAELLEHVGDYLERVLADFAPAGGDTWA